jgi:hypothetical protein
MEVKKAVKNKLAGMKKLMKKKPDAPRPQQEVQAVAVEVPEGPVDVHRRRRGGYSGGKY